MKQTIPRMIAAKPIFFMLFAIFILLIRAKVHKKFKPTKETAKTSTIIAIFSYFDANKRKSIENARTEKL